MCVGEQAVDFAAEDAGVVEGDVKDVHRRVLDVKGLLAAVPRHAVLKAVVDDQGILAVVVIDLSRRHEVPSLPIELNELTIIVS